MAKFAVKSNQYPTVILVTGLPCTGKTTIATNIAKYFDFPFITKDRLKERLFDTVSSGDREISKKLSYATFSILDYLIESMLEASSSFLMEGNFSSSKVFKPFADYKERYNFQLIVIECQTEGKILLERFRQRAKSGERHPGHMDFMLIDEIKEDLLRGRPETPIQHADQTITLNTTNFNTIDLEDVISKINTQLNNHTVL